MRMSKIAGSCLCGKVTYKIEGGPLNKALCHCNQCQKNSGSIYSTNIVIANDFFKSSGKTKSYSTKAETGRVVTFVFCPECGSPLWREGDMVPDAKVVRAGTLDEKSARDDAVPLAEVYTENRAEWLREQSEAKQFPKMF
ncbi:hypothetical protein G6514_004394 [Epicoccum nigrum]|nr:hypothetical protein G6514_004394 [Epicoccum nigrum]